MNAVAAITTNEEARALVCQTLMDGASAQRNTLYLARMLTTQKMGGGALPPGLGLSPDAFSALWAAHFPNATAPLVLCSDPDPSREPERLELKQLFLAHAPEGGTESGWIAEILATGCMGGNHLWQDLGLWSRKDVSALITENFPSLAAKNDRDMKWKKFFYKQLCNQEGIYTCRSPSCEVCNDYRSCFGAEE